MFSASRACARVSSEVEIKDYAVKLSFSFPLIHMYIVVAWPCCGEGQISASRSQYPKLQLMTQFASTLALQYCSYGQFNCDTRMKWAESLNTTTTEILTRRRIATQGVWRVSVNRYSL